MPPIAPIAQFSGSGFGNVGSYSKIGTCTVCAVAPTKAAAIAVAIARVFIDEFSARHYTTCCKTRYSSPLEGREILNMKLAAWLVTAAVVVTTAVPVLAHHSFAMYDHTRTVTLKG